MSPLTESLAIFLAGVVAGLINAVAGGGTLITFPALIFYGLPSVNANATNTVGVVPGVDKFVAEYVSSKAMSKDGYLALKGLISLPPAEAKTVAANATSMKTLTASDVK